MLNLIGLLSNALQTLGMDYNYYYIPLNFCTNPNAKHNALTFSFPHSSTPVRWARLREGLAQSPSRLLGLREAWSSPGMSLAPPHCTMKPEVRRRGNPHPRQLLSSPRSHILYVKWQGRFFFFVWRWKQAHIVWTTAACNSAFKPQDDLMFELSLLEYMFLPCSSAKTSFLRGTCFLERRAPDPGRGLQET